MTVIPNQTMLFILAYSSDAIDCIEDLSIDTGNSDGPTNLLATVLSQGVLNLRSLGFLADYSAVEEQTSSLRGRIDFQRSISTAAVAGVRLWCEIDQLSSSSIEHQRIKFTLEALRSSRDLLPQVRGRIGEALNLLQEVAIINGRASDPVPLPIRPRPPIYRLLLDICDILLSLARPLDLGSSYAFPPLDQSEKSMRRIFEQFVRNFYRAESGFKVRRPQFCWRPGELVQGTHTYLHFPRLSVDALLEGGGRRIVVETKYTYTHFQTYRGKQSFRSAHINQLYSYLANLAKTPGAIPEGILLYPSLGGPPLVSTFLIHGFRFSVASVDLAMSIVAIRARLLDLLRNDAVHEETGAA